MSNKKSLEMSKCRTLHNSDSGLEKMMMFCQLHQKRPGKHPFEPTRPAGVHRATLRARLMAVALPHCPVNQLGMAVCCSKTARACCTRPQGIIPRSPMANQPMGTSVIA